MMIKHFKNKAIDKVIHLAMRYIKSAKSALTKEHEKIKREITSVEQKIKMADINHTEEDTRKKLRKRLHALRQQNEQLEATFSKLVFR